MNPTASRFLSTIASVPTGILLVMLLAAFAHASDSSSTSAAAPTPVDEAGYVEIGGVEQWVSMRGDDRNNPIILVLHGGPGNALSPFATALFADWHKDFTVVQWDQPGSGRTFVRNGEAIGAHMSIAQMTRDGAEVATYAAKRLGQDKVILLGQSWGSILGVHLAKARPDLIHAYVGQSQFVNWNTNLAASYAQVMNLARAANDRETVEGLTQLGPPPWDRVRAWPQFRRRQMLYQRKLAAEGPLALQMDPAYAGAEEQAQNEAAEEFSFLHFWGMQLDGPLTRVDLPALGTKFDVPIFIVHGEHDLVATTGLAREYVAGIEAPEKAFVIAPGAGHETSATLMKVTHELMLTRVRPLRLNR